jgi:O-antigen/teichoic acid export membrane protein
VSAGSLVGQRPGLRARLAPYRRTVSTTAGLVVAIILNSATGFVFWWIAAHLFPPAAVGVAGAAVSAMLLLSQVGVLGLGTQLAGVLHAEERPVALAVTALVAATAAGAVLGLAFALIAPLLSAELAILVATPLTVLVFVAGVSLTTLGSVLDQVLVTVFRGGQQLLRNVVFSFSRLAVLAVFAAVFAPVGMVIYGAWTVGVILSLVLLGLLIRRAGMVSVRPLMWRPLLSMARNSFSHHVLDLSRSSSLWLLPLLVTVILSPHLNASFYIAMLLANFVAVVGKSGTFTLYIVGAREPHEMWRHLRLTLAVSVAISVVGTIGFAVLGQRVLLAFGPTYADAFPALAILGLSCVPLAVKDHWIAIQRVRGTVARAAVLGVGLLVIELAASAFGAMQGGLMGLSVARLVVLVGQSVFMLPQVYSSLFPGSVTDGLAVAAAEAAGAELEA